MCAAVSPCQSALEQAAQTAADKGKQEGATAEDGPWMFTLDAPSYMAVRMHAKDRALREKVYRAYLARASEFSQTEKKADGKGDNAPLIEKILALRKEKAELLGYSTFAEVSMAKKMATLERAEELLEDIRSRARPAAERELEEIRAFAKEAGAPEAETGGVFHFYTHSCVLLSLLLLFFLLFLKAAHSLASTQLRLFR